MLRRVHGYSMQPTLRPGRLVLAVRPRKVKQGDIIIVWHDNLEKIKRIARVEGGRIFVRGDNFAESIDSRTFGWLDTEAIVAKVMTK